MRPIIKNKKVQPIWPQQTALIEMPDRTAYFAPVLDGHDCKPLFGLSLGLTQSYRPTKRQTTDTTIQPI